MSSLGPEPIRLVVWDLDETFWHGTLSEGGHRYRREVHDIVIELARRGIVSSICSKNDLATVREVLEAEGIWEYFVFPSVNWDAKGPRLARMVEAVQLRAPTILFIDDNPMNLGEAQHFVPGLQVSDEHIIETMLDSPLLRGKPDPELARLKQYKLLETRQAAEAEAGGDNTAFLRESGIVVTIEHDLELHLDRAIDLINRTNQLNFTKRRLPEDMEAARAELRELLSGHAIQAGILHVRDRYGDYGYCGLYVVHTGLRGHALKHFCFSCRILNMGVESWLYQRLGRPRLKITGEVLTNVVKDTRTIDWITIQAPQAMAAVETAAPSFDYIFARGGCDLHALAHYFNIGSGTIYGEYNTVEDGLMLPLHHSMFARHAITGLPPAAQQVFSGLGYGPEHFRSFLGKPAPDGRGLWILSFWAEAGYALYEHGFTGKSVPVTARAFKATLQDISKADPEKFKADAQLIARVRRHLTFKGPIGEEQFKENLRLILGRKPADTRVFILLATEDHMGADNLVVTNKRKQRVNQWTAAIAGEFTHVELLSMTDFATAQERTNNPNHFDRMVYFKVFQEIMRRVRDEDVATAA
jgi:FkbH-like protein